MSSPRALTVTGGVLLAAAWLFTISTPAMARGPAMVALAAFVVGLALLIAGMIRMATTTALIVAGALLQLGGVVLFAIGEPRVPRGFVVVATALSAIGFWLLLAGVIAAGVKLARQEDEDLDRRAERER